MKTILIITLVAFATIQSATAGRKSGRRAGHHQRGREFGDGGGGGFDSGAGGGGDHSDIIAEANDNIAAIEEALAMIHKQQDDIYNNAQSMSPPEVQKASENLQATILDAIELENDNPEAQEYKEEIVAEKIQDSRNDLKKYLKEAKRHQKALLTYTDMTAEETVEHSKGLQKYLELALHETQQNGIAVLEDKAIQNGSPPEVVESIAPNVIAQGRYFRGKGRG